MRHDLGGNLEVNWNGRNENKRQKCLVPQKDMVVLTRGFDNAASDFEFWHRFWRTTRYFTGFNGCVFYSVFFFDLLGFHRVFHVVAAVYTSFFTTPEHTLGNVLISTDDMMSP